MNVPHPVFFTDIQRVLALFTQGLTARRLHLRPRETRTADVRVHALDVDGPSIHLPAGIASFDSAGHNLGAYRIAVLHQIGYLENGTFDFDLRTAASRMRLPVAAEAPAELRAQKRLVRPKVHDLERFLSGGTRPALLRRVFVTLEDLRIDTAMRRRYPGARADLDRVLAHALASRPPASAKKRLSALLDALVRFSLGAQRAELEKPDATGLVSPVLDLAQDLRRPSADVYDSARGALAICDLVEALFRRAPLVREAGAAASLETPTAAGAATGKEGAPAGEAADGEAEPAQEDFDIPGVEFRGELPPHRAWRHLAGGTPGGSAQSVEAGIPPDAVPPAGEHPVGDPPTPAAPPRASARRPGQDAPLCFHYDEWDCHARTYLKAWCRLYEHRLRGEDFDFIVAARRRNAALAERVRRQFGFIKPESWRRVHHASDGDEPDIDAIVEAVTDRRSGHATDEHLYLRRDRGLREVAAAFLVDTSASTDFPIPDPVAAPVAAPAESDPYLWGRAGGPLDLAPSAAKRRVIDVAKEALALMCDALERLGDSHAVYGFSGDGRENVEFNVIKDFRDRLSARTWAALAAMEPRRATRMGPAIRHAAAKLMREPLVRKVLIIVSDGYPEDRDYGPDRRDREYGILDTARALEEAARAGISTFCITIDPAGNDYLRRMCEPDRYLVIDDVASLPAELSKVYRTLTQSGRRARRHPARRPIA